MKNQLKCTGINKICMLYLLMFCSLGLTGCIEKLFGYKGEKVEEEQNVISVLGTVTRESDYSPLPFATVELYKRSRFEDWVMGGYDYVDVRSIQANENGTFIFTHKLRDCANWIYFVHAYKTTDSLRYFSEPKGFECTTKSYNINILVQSGPLIDKY